MMLPQMLNIKDFMDSPSAKIFDYNALIQKAYDIFYNDFYIEGVFYEGQKVYIRPKILDCSVCNNDCNNKFCTCDICSWKDKEDLFQHITSDYDSTLENKLTKDAKKIVKKRRKSNPNYKVRTPGLFSKSRTIRIPFLKTIIENSNDSDIQKIVTQTKNNEYKIKLYHKKENYLVILVCMIYVNGSKQIFLNSAYHNPFSSLLRDFK